MYNSKIAGSHAAVYEAYYNQADPKGTGSIGALDAANFLKKSGLKDLLLSQIWDLSDPTGKGYLEKPGFYVALKLVALAQNNQELNLSNLTNEAPQPNLGPVDLTPKQEPLGVIPGGIPWKVTNVEKTKYDQLFDSLVPVNGLLSGEKVRPMLMNSNLPVDVLGIIWELSDIDKDGCLDRDEFSVAMHLVYRAIEKEPVPAVLPIALVPPSKRRSNPIPGGVHVLPGAVPVLPMMGGRSTPTLRSDSPSMGGQWVVTVADKTRYDAMFKNADKDMDGYVTGPETREIFVQSGLPNNLLAHIWSLCDVKSLGKLNSDQFALAMYLINQKIKGIDPPLQLTPEMIPPSMRSGTDTAAFGITDATNAGPFSHVADFSAIKELDIIQKDIEDMKREKLNLERDDLQTEADIKICNGEVQMLQKELDSINATLYQLESQKKEAQKRLDELDEKKSELMANVTDMKEKCDKEGHEIEKLKEQIDNQAMFVKNQEEELNKLKTELNTLRQEETKLEQQVESGKQQLEMFAKSKKDIQLEVSQTKVKVQHLEDQLNAVQMGKTFNGEVSGILASQIDDQMSTRATLGSPHSTLSGYSVGSGLDDFKDDPFKSKDPFGGGGAAQADPFQSDDPFKGNDPFKGEGFSSDPFGAEDPFKNSFEGSTTSSNKSDPFGTIDPFGGSFSSTSSSSKKTNDSFDPFGGGGNKAPSKPVSLFADDDPFAPKPSPTKKNSQSPALPTKDKKKPPPRPAPPKSTPSPIPSKTAGSAWNDPFAGNDPFSGSGGGKTTGSDAFANFADFSPGKFDDTNAWGS